MNDEYVNYIILLENTLASFYENIKDHEKYERLKTLFEFMETHSFTHALQIEEYRQTKKRPDLSKDIILDYQNNLTRKVMKEIAENKDLKNILDTLAESEEKLGDLYKMISRHMLDLADYYKDMAAMVEKIANDEYSHRDLLLKDKEKLK